MGNLNSVRRKLYRIGVNAAITSEPSDILRADKLILPGVGHFKNAVENLKEYGFWDILNLAVLEKKTGIPLRFLSQIINEEFKMSFTEFVNTYRIKEAEDLLLKSGSEFTVQQIMYDVGFNSKSAFNTAFRKCCGCTPTELKQKAMAA